VEHNKVLNHLLAEYSEEVASNTRSLVDGAAKTLEDYRYTCGVIQGLNLARSYIEDLLRRLENFDD
jgi:hypothetical protein